jgi:uncharacterized membrane protein YvbJ
MEFEQIVALTAVFFMSIIIIIFFFTSKNTNNILPNGKEIIKRKTFFALPLSSGDIPAW